MAKLLSLMARARVLTLITVLLPVASAGGEADEPDVRLRASPRVSMAPLGGAAPVLLTAEIVGPEDEEYYCPEVVWVWSDRTRSSTESDCAPFPERTEYPRRFTRRVASPRSVLQYSVCVMLRKGGEVIDKSCTRYKVH